MEHPNAWNSYDEAALSELESLAQDYRRFISENKTERECAATAIAMARESGYVSLDEARAAGRTLAAGDKVYAESYGKTLILAHIGTRPLEDGLNILGAHIDSPRLDIKQNPLYESGDLALLDTHYYGGVKKYQWVTPARHSRRNRQERRHRRARERWRGCGRPRVLCDRPAHSLGRRPNAKEGV